MTRDYSCRLYVGEDNAMHISGQHRVSQTELAGGFFGAFFIKVQGRFNSPDDVRGAQGERRTNPEAAVHRHEDNSLRLEWCKGNDCEMIQMR